MTARIISALAIALLVTGCANAPRIWLYGGYYDDAQTSAFRFSGANRDFRTSVVGNPFNAPQADTERAVVEAMKGEDKGLNTHFTLTPRTNYKNYHIVMLFNPLPRSQQPVCRTPRSTGSTTDGAPLVLVALFCDGDSLVFGVGGSRIGIKGPGDPALGKLVKDVMLYFVPRHSMIDEPKEEDEKN